jgi:SAM-dependent methyltransferase
MENIKKFYAGLAPLYHLIYPDWNISIVRQGNMLDAVIRENWGDVSDILDVSCGIGTQALGLAGIGYVVTASDLSQDEIDRAKREAADRNFSIMFSVADMRRVFEHYKRQFDVVISCDNSVPHLLSDEDIRCAMKQLYDCTRPGGGCIISVRDYETEDLSEQKIKPYGIREENGIRWLIWQVWDPSPPTYDVTMYFVEDRGKSVCKTYAFKSTYYAIGMSALVVLMQQAGFEDVRRLDGNFFQPLIIGTRKAQPEY